MNWGFFQWRVANLLGGRAGLSLTEKKKASRPAVRSDLQWDISQPASVGHQLPSLKCQPPSVEFQPPLANRILPPMPRGRPYFKTKRKILSLKDSPEGE